MDVKVGSIYKTYTQKHAQSTTEHFVEILYTGQYGLFARFIDGDLNLSTSGGHIDLDTISGSSDVKTSGGHISLRNMRGPVEARTSGGHIKANFSEGLSSDTILKTSGGSIKVYLPSDEAFHLVAKTSAGHIKTDFPIEVTGKFITNAAVGDVNGGGPELQLHTSAGGIKINKL